MKKFNFIKKASLALASALAVVLLTTGVAHATIPYSGDTTPNSPIPAFNVFTGVPAPVGNEPDFLRARAPINGDSSDATTQYVDPLNTSCTNGEVIQMRVYVHNGASTAGNENGTGPSVAHNTKVKVNLDNAAAQSVFTPSATISASNAASVSDNVTINCGGKTVKLDYIKGSASAFSLGTGVVPVDENTLFTTGASIRSEKVPGDVWGCWNERVYVVLSVKVEVPQTTPQESFACTLSNFVVDNRTVKITIAPQVKNVTVIGYDVSWGDNTPNSTTQTSSHTYAQNLGNGPFPIVARFQIKHTNGQTEWVTSNECTKSVSFTVAPTPAPTQLTNTGAGNMLGIFAATSAIGAFLHRRWTLSRAK